MNRIILPLFVLLIIVACIPTQAQDSTHVTSPDSIIIGKNGKVTTIESYAARYNPRKAMLYSAVLPGLGQAYNKKYWKIPLVIGGFVGTGYGIWEYNRRYQFYKNGLFNMLNEPANPEVDPETGLTALGNRVINGELFFPVNNTGQLRLEIVRNAVNRNRRDRDFSVVMTFIFYMMQMVDAHVDAHLKEFDLNPQLKVSLEPTMDSNAFTGRTAGVGLTLKF